MHRFADIHGIYTKHHGFRSVIAVRGNAKAAILAAYERCIANPNLAEFSQTCSQVERIAEQRLKDVPPG
jgi:2-oxo-4-hydroxy-4-carboxy--5-ureidoimidazoline (OHCU) decarboxylase